MATDMLMKDTNNIIKHVTKSHKSTLKTKDLKQTRPTKMSTLIEKKTFTHINTPATIRRSLYAWSLVL